MHVALSCPQFRNSGDNGLILVEPLLGNNPEILFAPCSSRSLLQAQNKLAVGPRPLGPALISALPVIDAAVGAGLSGGKKLWATV
jgi:hypothetical protein